MGEQTQSLRGALSQNVVHDEGRLVVRAGDTHCKISNYSWLCPWWWWRWRRRGAGARAARAAGAWRALAGAVRAALCTPRPLEIIGGRAGSGRCNKQTAAIRGAVTQRRQPELNADTVCCRPSWGFLPFSLAGLRAAVVDPRPLAALAPGTATHHPTGSGRTPRAPDAGFSFRFITYRLLMIVNFAWLVNIHASGADDALASHDACEVGDVRVAACARINQGPSDCSIAALINRCDCDVHSEGTVQCAKQT